jgi:hypothetical protein
VVISSSRQGALKTALNLPRLHKNTETRILHPCLVKALPNWHALDTHYVSNFRKRAVEHWSIHGSLEDEDSDLTMIETELLVSAPTVVHDNIDLNDKYVRTNYEKLFRHPPKLGRSKHILNTARPKLLDFIMLSIVMMRANQHRFIVTPLLGDNWMACNLC